MRQRRRVERGRFDASTDRSKLIVNRREIEDRQRKFVLIVAVVALAIVVLLVGAGWFVGFYQPPRRTVATVAGEDIRLSELVSYTSMAAFENNRALRPDLALNDLVRDRVVNARAGELGVTISQADIEAELALRFEPFVQGATRSADALTEAGRSSFTLILDTLDVSEDLYREWLIGRLSVGALQAHFREQQPEEMEQIFLEWIVTESSLTSQTVMDRIANGEEFATVAAELSIDFLLSNTAGEVGWVPEGAISELDAVLFTPTLELNTLMGPLTTSLGSVVVRVTAGPSEEPLSDVMREFVAAEESQQWLNSAVTETLEGRIALSADDFDWVIDQIV